MDAYATQLANFLVGNKAFAPLMEITLNGPVLQFNEVANIAICGGDLAPELNGNSIAMNESHRLSPGDKLSFGPVKNGCRAYLAIEGGFVVPDFMGSSSTYVTAGMGGYKGRSLKKKDVLNFTEPKTKRKKRKLPDHFVPHYDSKRTVRIIKGAEWEEVGHKVTINLLTASFFISSESNRMGIRLESKDFQKFDTMGILSSPVLKGTIQVPSGSRPIIIMSDGQTIGGYARIAHVISVDLPYVAQLKPGDELSFKLVGFDETRQLYISLIKKLNSLAEKWKI